MIPKKLKIKIDKRNEENALRTLGKPNNLVDFYSNDYLGFSKNETIYKNSYNYLKNYNISQNGATGSRLLSGNHELYTIVEQQLCEIYDSEATLIFNSGYNANLGFFSCVPQKGDYIFYDEYSHASIRDGITMSNAKAYKFKHNNLNDLKAKLLKAKPLNNNEIYVVTESVFSMDGDTPDLKLLSKICQTYNANLIIDEAHAINIQEKQALGLTQNINTFAKIITFGKAMGCHGAAIVCSKSLKEFLINFSRPFIYTTAMPPHSLATILCAYTMLLNAKEVETLKRNITFFKSEIKRLKLQNKFIESKSAIQCCIIPGNKNVKLAAKALQEKNYNVKPILSPTVKKGEERLRFCIHSYNSQDQITQVLQLLANFAT